MLVDAITERATSFRVGSVHYALYPQSLGVHLLSSRLIAEMSVNEEILQLSPELELLRLATEERDRVLRLIVINTAQTREQATNEAVLKGRIKHFGNRLKAEEIALLLSLLLTTDNYEAITQHYGIDKEVKDRELFARGQKDSSMLLFGGKTIYGTLIDYASERYGWTMDYIVWGISYMNLRLLMSDAIQSVYPNEKSGVSSRTDIINADDPNNQKLIEELLAE